MAWNRRALAGVLATVLSIWHGSEAGAQMPGEEKNTKVVFDHATTNDNQIVTRHVLPGEVITVEIKNTCPAEFTFNVVNVRPGAAAPPPPTCMLGTQKVEIVHDSRNGGYVVQVRKRVPGAQVQAQIGNKLIALNEVDIIINVVDRKWDAEMSGAFTVSQLTDEKFGVVMRDDPDDTEENVDKPFLVRDDGADDEARLGVGAFIHVFKPRYPWGALTFGIGINDDNQTSYFTGLSWRWGDAGALTLGYNWASVKRLPAGIDTSRPVAADVLTRLENQTKGDVFLALSFKFLNPTGRLEKPFQTVGQASGQGGAGQGGAGQGGAGQGGAGQGGAGQGGAGQGGAGQGGAGQGGAGQGGAGQGGAGQPPQPPLAAPANLRAEAEGCNQVSLSWDAVNGAQTYTLFRSQTSCDSTSSRQQDIRETRVTDIVAPGRFFYRVGAAGANGLSGAPSDCAEVAVCTEGN